MYIHRLYSCTDQYFIFQMEQMIQNVILPPCSDQDDLEVLLLSSRFVFMRAAVSVVVVSADFLSVSSRRARLYVTTQQHNNSVRLPESELKAPQLPQIKCKVVTEVSAAGDICFLRLWQPVKCLSSAVFVSLPSLLKVSSMLSSFDFQQGGIEKSAIHISFMDQQMDSFCTCCCCCCCFSPSLSTFTVVWQLKSFWFGGLSFTQKASNRRRTKTSLWTNDGLSVRRGSGISLTNCEPTGVQQRGDGLLAELRSISGASV